MAITSSWLLFKAVAREDVMCLPDDEPRFDDGKSSAGA